MLAECERSQCALIAKARPTLFVHLDFQAEGLESAFLVLAEAFAGLPAHFLQECHAHPALDGGSSRQLVLKQFSQTNGTFHLIRLRSPTDWVRKLTAD